MPHDDAAVLATAKALRQVPHHYAVDRALADPCHSLTRLQQQSVLLNVFIGSAQGTLCSGRDCAVQHARTQATGTRSALSGRGLDRFWRNARFHTRHNPAEYKLRNVGRCFPGAGHPTPGALP